jgi:NTP pyrophosphatase (non-canonical NTP hydrolase)
MPDTPAARPSAPPSDPTRNTIRATQEINAARSARWMAGSPGWTTLEIAGELAGEVGELANICKKLRRSEMGVPGNKVSDDELREQARGEMADVFIVLMLTASKLGIDLEDAVRETFNRKSEQMGFPERIPGRSGDGDPTPPDEAMLLSEFSNAATLLEQSGYRDAPRQVREAVATLRAALACQRAARARAEEERTVVVMELARTLMELGRVPDPRMAGVGGDTVELIRTSIAAPRQFVAVSRPLTAEEAQAAVTSWLSRASGQPEAVSRDA